MGEALREVLAEAVKLEVLDLGHVMPVGLEEIRAFKRGCPSLKSLLVASCRLQAQVPFPPPPCSAAEDAGTQPPPVPLLTVFENACA